MSGGAKSTAPAAPLAGPMLIFGGLLLAVANFMVVLDTTIANVSVPNIAGGLAVSPSQGTWVITSYSVAEAISVPLTGWLAQRFGPARVFALAMISFGIWSFCCGLAPSLGVLVVCRVLQGLSGGPMIPLSQTLLMRIFPKDKAPLAIGIWSMTTVTAPIAGPILGGTICDTWNWPWVFFINVPIALGCGWLIWRLLGNHNGDTQRLPIDYVGLGLLVVWVGALQIMLDKGKELDWFGSPTIVLLAIVAAVGLASFLIWELTQQNPIVDLRVFRYRGFTIGAAILALGFGAYFSVVVLTPLWLQTSLGYTATQAGDVMAFNGILAVIMSPIVARLITRIDTRLLVSFGLIGIGVVGLTRTEFTSNLNFMAIAFPNLIQGAFIPFFFIPLTGLALSSVRPDETASAAGLANFMRTTAGAFGTSLVTTNWDNFSTRNRVELVGQLNGAPDLVAQLSAQGMTSAQATSQLDLIVNGQAVMLATNNMFLFTALIFVGAGAAVWLVPKPGRAIAQVG